MRQKIFIERGEGTALARIFGCSIRLFADVRELRSVVQEEQREGTAHTQGSHRAGRAACEF